MQPSSDSPDLSRFAQWLAPQAPGRRRLYLAWAILLAWVAFLVVLYLLSPRENPFGGTGLG